MAVITHATPSDLTFSATGAIAWDADHTIDPVALRALLGVIDGVPGLQGRDGESGEDGAIGPPGQQGTAGSAGANGADGIPGQTIRGDDGNDGQDGLTAQPINYPGTTTVFLSGDGTFATVPATVPDIALSLLAPTVDETITAGYSGYVVDYYEIASGKFLEVGSGSVFEIG